MKNQGFGILSLAAAGLLAWAPLAAADTLSACLNDSPSKACLSIASQPHDKVQASKLNGEDVTYAYYTATVSSIDKPTSSRMIEVSFTMSPAVTVFGVTSSAGVDCTENGATFSCVYDKLETSFNDEITFTAEAPEYAGANTPATLVATGTIGWEGRASTVTKTLEVTTNGGKSWVPPDDEEGGRRISTGPQNPDPSQQTDSDDQMWATAFFPSRDVGYVAYLVINENTDEDFSQSCSAGLFFSGNSDGGPYLCRDIGDPYDAGNPNRWVEISVDESVNDSFTDTPVQVQIIWDQSILSPARLDSDAPPVAVYYHAQEEEGSTETHPIRAYSNSCDANVPPCLSNVELYDTNDLTATLNLSTVHNDGAEADPLTSTVLDLLSGLTDYLVRVAHGELVPPVIMK